MFENPEKGFFFNTISDPTTIVDNITVRQQAITSGYKEYLPSSGVWRSLADFGAPGMRFVLDKDSNRILLILGDKDIIFGAYLLR
ncbi:hypothetical protein A3K34_01675 [candidate division WWE3 bacterium RIFOXYC1_FULL_40_10]|uniref:Uncharacterized protein n=1 Tax=candidate division WWE3 bacterium RIFOXYA2_FULL_46_9 TaxID=1802636 RepID=A0A1F4W2K4_UNCKA|nr:MAG: hypothetical protein A3K58_01675 [candidate division WWE3 bacterium RIFOXYB1_FULL_40_22]OGC61575.1 MAG: hypothetical protein A3K37_01675 [candidate division WWE3 bacterium RIFOXYA1_FULL_40_11]OGC63621.1 MAG: hypothetical protein A2264_04615 [candidate division WWE3 bacterium RIFOXYA2_FULL_46_9]OGC64748.1 MAG: hypothetical protein A2326_01780 [candidate division WWE3 bacterium RIFOXYB2_FULL_41_6]OGC65958.1 MAG: hypothetical protein A3K34_01675 [candidate division WWE3 bacterium RIFOXYC1_